MSKLSDRVCWDTSCPNPERCNILRSCVTRLRLQAALANREEAFEAEISKRAGPDPLEELARLIGQSDPFLRSKR